jgi:hypothetical protein
VSSRSLHRTKLWLFQPIAAPLQFRLLRNNVPFLKRQCHEIFSSPDFWASNSFPWSQIACLTRSRRVEISNTSSFSPRQRYRYRQNRKRKNT